VIHTLWFVVLALMLTGYAVLDGFDLGVGTLHLVLGRTLEEREALIDSIGPVWNGNEVWLIAAGGAMVAAFPTLYATSFSGFYLALMLVLWLLILRGLAIEFRHQIHHPLWEQAWDVVFCLSSALLTVLFGIAMGNVLRGVPLDARGQFQGSFALMLNPFAGLGGLLGLVTLALQGAAWVAVKTDGPPRQRGRTWRTRLAWMTAATLAAFIAASRLVRPDFTSNFAAQPALLLVPLLGLGGLAVLVRRPARDGVGFLASSTVVASALGSAAAGLYPVLLSARPASAHPALDIYNAAAPDGSLRIALAIYVTGMIIVLVYLRRIYAVWLRPAPPPPLHRP
jgi:cytochrome d ubiquinol oxidase subunit II